MKPVSAFVGIGANLGAREKQVREAALDLAELAGTQVIALSSLYRSAPVGYKEQPDFINAVARIDTTLSPRALLEALLAIERRHGRRREFANSPRTLDLDVLLYGAEVVHEPGLTIPHPRMYERAFVVVPLVEIAPDAVVPGRGCARDLLAGVNAASVRKLEVPAR